VWSRSEFFESGVNVSNLTGGKLINDWWCQQLTLEVDWRNRQPETTDSVLRPMTREPSIRDKIEKWQKTG